MPHLRPTVLFACVSLWACEKGETPSLAGPVARASAPALEEKVAVTRAEEKPLTVPSRPQKGAEIAIAAGSLRLGSPTGSVDRNPAREADDLRVEVPAFAIDALPHPNDPDAPFTHSVSKTEAEKLCAKDEKRLCSEFEWERACKGDENLAYPSVKGFDAAHCASDPLACASPFGVFAMGTRAREWTRDKLKEGFGDALRTAVVRGATSDAEPRLHRCAARDAATPDSRSQSLTFRCCRGEVPELVYPSEREKAPFEELAALELRDVLASMAETKSLSEGARLFSGDERTKSLAQAGYSRSGVAPWTVSEKPLVWRPTRGEELRVLSFDTPRGAALVAYYPLGDDKNLFAGSYETKGEHTALIIAYKVDVPAEVLFSTCWGCGGEGGALSLGDDGRVHIVQR